ncbi:hypothetical protein ACJJTC_017868 [Scirpophaga incertulas]
MMGLANCLKRYNKGVKQGKRSTLRRVNKYKIGVVFERPGLANAALQNKKFLEAYNLTVSIPAAASEVTGVITHVPTELSNEQIYSALTSTNNIMNRTMFVILLALAACFATPAPEPEPAENIEKRSIFLKTVDPLVYPSYPYINSPYRTVFSDSAIVGGYYPRHMNYVI